MQGAALGDTGAMKNYISTRDAKRANVRFIRSESVCSVELPNGQEIKILGQCEFVLTMSEWSGIVAATILDLEADFDVILGLAWYRQWICL